MKKYIIINLQTAEYFTDVPFNGFTPILMLSKYFETRSAADDQAIKLPAEIYEIKEIIIKD